MAKKKATAAVKSVPAEETNEKLMCGVTPAKYRALMAGVKKGLFTREELEEAGELQPARRKRSSEYIEGVLERLGKK